jgi:hypothetical protein
MSHSLPPPSGADARTGKAKAMVFLKAVLASGPMPAADVNRIALEHGLSAKVVRTAREALWIKAKRDGFGPGSKWVWFLPTHRYQLQNPAH